MSSGKELLLPQMINSDRRLTKGRNGIESSRADKIIWGFLSEPDGGVCVTDERHKCGIYTMLLRCFFILLTLHLKDESVTRENKTSGTVFFSPMCRVSS